MNHIENKKKTKEKISKSLVFSYYQKWMFLLSTVIYKVSSGVVTVKDFLKQVLLIWIGVNLSKQTFKEQKSKVGRVSNMKPQEIINNGGK